MKIICDCGAVSELVKEDEYTDGEGWSTRNQGDIQVGKSYYQVFMKCEKCGEEIWFFT